MAASTGRPDLNAFMDAYVILEVKYAANPLDIRKAYKRKARAHHPDRLPAGSPEHRQATERMAAVNAAYQLIREAPLRHHRISTGAQPDDPWTDDDLDAALRRSRMDTVLSRGICVALAVAGFGIYLFFLPALSGWHAAAGPVVGMMVVLLAYLFTAHMPESEYVWRIIYIVKVVMRF
jgi:hypothetical protein